jgi:ATP-dependent DNA helicase UvrD/PcrA
MQSLRHLRLGLPRVHLQPLRLEVLVTNLPVPTDLILGPPGTGKTTELLRRCDDLFAAGVEPTKVGYYAFTRRASIEAADRAMRQFGFRRGDLPHFRTIHSESMRQAGLSSSEVLDGDRLREFSDWIGERVTGRFSMEEGLMSGYERGDRMLFMDNLARVRMIPLRQQYEEDHDDLDWHTLDRFSRGLREYKARKGLVDYTDMLERFVLHGRPLGLHTAIFDEAQDMSPLLWAAAAVICGDAKRVVVGGDDDQAIYRWAGADVGFLLELEGNVTVLGQSYRVPRAIQRVAGGIIGRVSARRDKDWAPRPEEGSVHWASGLEEIDWTGPGVLALARNQYLLIPVMRELKASGVLYEYHGHPSVSQKYLSAAVTWEKLRAGESQPVDEVRKMYQLLELGRGVSRGHKTLSGVAAGTHLSGYELRASHGLLTPPAIWHQALTLIPAEERQYMIRMRRQGERFSQPARVRIGTIHDSKGGERSRVVLLTDMAPRTHGEMVRGRDPDSEHRVFYVGATRAIDELVVVRPRTSLNYNV